MDIHKRYKNDPIFKNLVDALEHMIETCQLTPSELREGAILAAIHYDQRHIVKEKFLRPDFGNQNDKDASA